MHSAGEETPDWGVLLSVVVALGRLRPPSAVAALSRLVVGAGGAGRVEMGVAREAIDALVAVGDDRGIPPLLAAAAAVGGQPAVRASAANAAAMLGASPRAPRGTAKSVAAALGRLAADAATPDDVRDTATVAGAAVAAAAAAMPPPPPSVLTNQPRRRW